MSTVRLTLPVDALELRHRLNREMQKGYVDHDPPDRRYRHYGKNLVRQVVCCLF